MKKSLFCLLVLTIAASSTVWGQCEPAPKSRNPNSLFVNNGGSGHYVKAGQAVYAGILVEDKEGRPRVAIVNDNCTNNFENGDVIRTLNDITISSKKEWEKALKQYKKGDKVKISVERGEKQLTVDVILDTIDIYKTVI